MRGFKFVILILFLFPGNYSFGQIKIIAGLDTLLPDNESLYLATDYNGWNPGHRDFMLNKDSSDSYSIVLHNTPNIFEFKVTKGSWMDVEGSREGDIIDNRKINVLLLKNGLYQFHINGWERRITYPIEIENLPDNTPGDANIYISGNFNNWEPGDENYILTKNINGRFGIDLITYHPEITFKFTRGSWSSVESRSNGKARKNRVLDSKTLQIDKKASFNVEGWEDMQGTIHIYSFLDLIFLFSVFQGVLFLVFLPFLRPADQKTNQWLLFSILLTSLAVLFYFLSGFQTVVNAFPLIVLLPDFIYFLYAPTFYFYFIRLLFNIKGQSSVWYLHYIPFIIQFFVYLPFLIQNDKALLLSIMEQQPKTTGVLGISGAFGLIYNCYYWFLYLRAFTRYKNESLHSQSYEQNTTNINIVLFVQAMVLVFWMFSWIEIIITHFSSTDNTALFQKSLDLPWMAFSVVTFFTGYFALRKAPQYKAPPRILSVFDDVLETVPEDHKLEEKTEWDEEINLIEQYFQKEKPFINPKISLNELSSLLGLSPHTLSKVINDHYGLNFFDFINSYRIEEFKQQIKEDKHQNLTFLAIAFNAGFNSKTTFNRAFKKAENQTPREYLDAISQRN